MIFNSYIFLFIFLPVALAGFWLLGGKKNARYIFLTLLGYFFYGYWNYKFTFLMLFSTLISFGTALYISRASSGKKRKIALIAALTTDLALLGFFKYFNFSVATIQNLFDFFGHRADLPLLHIILPIGISFYTFHTMSYVIDVYRGKFQPTRNFFEFSTYVSFFPQLVAGPIVRWNEVSSDLNNLNSIKQPPALHAGISMFVVGLFKKVIIADSIANIIDPLWGNAAGLGSLGAWIAVAGYTYQLYFDFSGYSDMAIGLGRLFGIHLPQNFNSPYKAVSISDFWRRWHISLSNWLRDYIYIPLGGSKNGSVQTYINLLITMLLGGLWHGASWTFVFWGGYHGALLAMHKMFKISYERLPILFQRALTFFLIVIGWVFFRSPSFGIAGNMLKKMFGLDELSAATNLPAIAPTTIGLLALCLLITNFLPNSFEWPYSKKPRYAAAMAMIFVLALIFMNYKQSVFLYYQF